MSNKKLWNFFENPKSKLAIISKWIIIVLIVISSLLAIFQLLGYNIKYLSQESIHLFELFVLGIFTLEFILRLYASPSKSNFFKDIFNWIDLMAIAPFYIGIESSTILRVFRALRLLRLIKISYQLKFFGFFDFKGSIFMKITPFVVLFTLLKGIILYLENKGFWFDFGDFSLLFTIIGFALGVVLSNKIRNSYQKYLKLEDNIFELHGKLNSLSANMNIMAKEKGMGNAGLKIVHDYLDGFIEIFKGEKEGAVRKLRILNRQMYTEAAKLGNSTMIPFHRLAAMMLGIYEESNYIMSKRVAFTPQEYDKFVIHMIVFYLLLITLFIPGINGLLSVVFASYLLYGLYYLTNEFDYIIGSDFRKGENNLITLDIQRLENYRDDLKSDMKKSKT